MDSFDWPASFTIPIRPVATTKSSWAGSPSLNTLWPLRRVVLLEERVMSSIPLGSSNLNSGVCLSNVFGSMYVISDLLYMCNLGFVLAG